MIKIKNAIIYADSSEYVDPIIFGYTLIKKLNIANRFFSIYKKNDFEFILAHSKIGLINAAMTAQILISHFNVKVIWNYGAVGSTNLNLNIYDIVIPEKIYFGDVTTPWYAFGQTPQEKEFYLNNLQNDKNISVNIASTNSFLSDKTQIDYIQQHINVEIFDMEIAAIAQVCFSNNVELKSLKYISDVIGKEKISIDNINKIIEKGAKNAFFSLLNKFEQI